MSEKTPRIALVGHCGPDSSYLLLATRKAAPGVTVERANDTPSLNRFLESGPALLLVNRVLEPGLGTESGIELIRQLKLTHPGARSMLVSNYADSQKLAVAAGAMPGFGKKDLGHPTAATAIATALATLVDPPTQP